MKFNVSSSEFAERLQQVIQVMSSKTIIPVFDFVKFTLQGDTLSLTASDGDITLTTSMQVDSPEGEGSFLVQGIYFSKLFKFGNQPLTFDVNEGNYSVEIKSPSGKYNYIGQYASEYPNPKELVGEVTEITIPSQDVVAAISMTMFASSVEDAFPQYKSLCFDYNQEGLIVLATDLKRLSSRKMTKYKTDNATRFLCPSKTVGLLKNFLAKENCDVEFKFDNSTVVIKYNNCTLTSRLVEGKFPNCKVLFDEERPVSVFVNIETLRIAVSRLVTCSPGAIHWISMNVSPNSIHLTSQNTDYSISGEENIECSMLGTDFIKVSYDGNSMLQVLGVLSSYDEVEIKLAEKQRAISIVPVGLEEGVEVAMYIVPYIE